MRYSIGFTKVVHGCEIIEAKDKEEAEKKFEEGDIEEEFDNKSNYNYDYDEDGKPIFEEMNN